MTYVGPTHHDTGGTTVVATTRVKCREPSHPTRTPIVGAWQLDAEGKVWTVDGTAAEHQPLQYARRTVWECPLCGLRAEMTAATATDRGRKALATGVPEVPLAALAASL